MDVLQDVGDTVRQVVIQQDRARIEILQAQAAAIVQAHEGFDDEHVAIWQRQRCRLGNLGRPGAEAHVQPRLAEDLHQARHVLQVLRRGVVQFRHDQQVAGVRTILVDGGHGRLHGQGQHFRGQVVEAAREQVGIDRGQLVAGIAQVYRAIERRRVLLPLHAKPALNGRRRGQNLFFEVEQRSGQGRDEMGNHSYILKLCAVFKKAHRTADYITV